MYPESRQVRFDEIKEARVGKIWTVRCRNPFDLEPEEEQLIGRYAKEEWDAVILYL